MKIHNYGYLLTMAALVIGLVSCAKTNSEETLRPEVKLTVVIKSDLRDHFFDELKIFGVGNGFDVDIHATDSTGRNYIVKLNRKDILIVGFNSSSYSLFKIGIYINPPEQVSTDVIDSLKYDLKSLIQKLGLEVTEK